MKVKHDNLLAFILIAFCSLVIFWQFFLKGLYPFPGNYLLAWYEPWKSDHFINGVISIPHKPINEDLFRIDYPFKTLSIDILKKFELPLWNPYNGSGMPLLANTNSKFLDPFNILFLFLTYPLAWSIYIIIQPILAGYFTFIYCRKIHLSYMSSLFSGFVFIFSGFVTTRLIGVSLGLAMSLLPFILYLLESYSQNQKSRMIYLLPITIFFLVTSTLPQISLYIIALCAFYLLYKNINLQTKNPILLIKKILLPLVLVIIGFGLSSIQILPTLELFKYANINNQSSTFIFDRFLLPPWHLITLLVPNYFGNPGTYNYWGYADYIETATYIGLLPCFFAVIAFCKKYSKEPDLKLFFLVLIIISSLLSLDWFLPKWIYSLSIPLISTGVPSRIFFITTFSVAILAGYGFEYWENKKEISRIFLKRIILFLLPILIIVITTFALFMIKESCPDGPIKECRLIAFRNTLVEFTAFITGLIIVISYTRLEFLRKKIKILVLIPIAIVILVGVYNDYKFIPFSPKESFSPENPLISVLQTKTLDARAFGFGKANIATDLATNFRFYDPQYYHPLYIKRYGELVGYANKNETKDDLPRSDVEIINDVNIVDPKQQARRERLLSLLGVKYFIFNKNETGEISNDNLFWKNDTWYIKINNLAVPRAYFVGNYEIIDNKELLLKNLFNPSFNPNTKVILEEEPQSSYSNIKIDKNASVNIKDYQENKVLLQTQSNSNQILVLTDNYYPGWKAFVDGKETRVYRANYSFRAIEVPSGMHGINFKYEPDSLKYGIILSFFSLLLYTFLASYKILIKRKE